MELSLKQLAEQISAEVFGNDNIKVSSVGPVESSSDKQVTFVSSSRHMAKLCDTKAAAVIVNEQVKSIDKPQLVVKDVDTALIKTLQIFAPKLKPVAPGIDDTARIADTAQIADAVSIGPFVIIEDGVKIGRNTVISNSCRICQNTVVGSNCRFDSGVVIYNGCNIGNNVVIQANSVIGGMGFGYSFIDGAHRLVPHNGGVIIEDYVDIGANSCIDRAKFGNTIIGAGTKIDNLVQIGHNVVIGKCCLLCSLVGIAGSCKVGDGVVMAGQSGIKDNIEIGDRVMIGAKAGVINDIEADKKVAGQPAIEYKDALRNIGYVMKLPEMSKQLKKLTARVKKLETSENNKN